MMKRFSLINFILFQSSWALAATLPTNAPFFMLILLGVHFLLTPSRMDDVFLLLCALIGIALDQTFIAFSLLDVGQNWVPFWLILLWGHFILCLNHSLKWLRQLNIIVIGLLGAVAGTFSYWMGWRLGVFDTQFTTGLFLVSYTLAWGILLPIFCQLANRIQNRHAHS